MILLGEYGAMLEDKTIHPAMVAQTVVDRGVIIDRGVMVDCSMKPREENGACAL
jgi:hypothetical protein